MKKLKFLALAIIVLISTGVSAQLSVNVNLGKPPVWAPVNAEKVQYYYIPEIETYYDVPAQRYIYQRNGKWFKSAALPAHYRHYNLKNGKIVYLTEYKGNSPYKYYKAHKVKYGKAKGHYKEKSKEHKNHEFKNNHKGKNHGKNHGKNKK